MWFCLNFADCAESSRDDSPEHVSLVSALEEKGFFGEKENFPFLSKLVHFLFWLHICSLLSACDAAGRSWITGVNGKKTFLVTQIFASNL